MSGRRTIASLLLALSALAMGGCATPPKPAEAASTTPQSSWTGRMALQVEDDASQSFSAAFELRGNASAGELTLLSPLGSAMAAMAWAPGAATLRAGGQTRQFESLDALVTQATGTPIPVGALFDWLAGVPTPVPGWVPDLTGVAQGRIRARRFQPEPVADLRVAFDN